MIVQVEACLAGSASELRWICLQRSISLLRTIPEEPDVELRDHAFQILICIYVTGVAMLQPKQPF